MPAVALIAHPARTARLLVRRVRLALRRLQARRGQRALVALRRDEVRVDALVRQVHEEGPRLVARLQPVERVVGQLVRDVALLRHLPAVDVQPVGRRQVGALAPEADPAIEPGLRSPIVVPHVPLAEEPGLVAGPLQVLREVGRPGRHRRVVVDHLVLVRVQPGEDARPARRAQGGRHERVLQVDAGPGDAVEAAASSRSGCP